MGQISGRLTPVQEHSDIHIQKQASHEWRIFKTYIKIHGGWLLNKCSIDTKNTYI